jgi:type IV pilus assembly protein PilM
LASIVLLKEKVFLFLIGYVNISIDTKEELYRMLNLFKSKQQSLLGIDISSTSVKILQVSGNPDNYCVDAYATGLIPSVSLDGNKLNDIDGISSTIRRLLSQSKFTTNIAAIAVPDSQVISKVIQINDGLNDAEMEELVLIEADKFITYPINEINLDFVVLGPFAKKSNLLDVLVIASRAENVSSRVEAIDRAGLELKIVDVESYAVERAAQLIAKDLPAHGLDKIIAIIDIDAVYTHLFVLHGMRMIFCREEEFGGKQLFASIAQHYGITYEQALNAKYHGELKDDYEEQLAGPFKESILLQVKRTLQFFYSTSNHGFVDYILLAGGVAKEPGLLELLQKNIGIPIKLVNPFAYMSVGKSVNTDILYKDAPSLMVACGLALRRTE